MERPVKASEVLVRVAADEELAAAGSAVRTAYDVDGLGDAESGYLDVVADAASRAGDGVVLVAVDGGGVVLGSVTYVVHGSPLAEVSRPSESEFRMLGVAPTGRGRGVGEALVRACVARAEADGATALVLSTDVRSRTAHRLYERLGFTRRPELDWTPVPGVDLICYSLALPPAAPSA